MEVDAPCVLIWRPRGQRLTDTDDADCGISRGARGPWSESHGDWLLSISASLRFTLKVGLTTHAPAILRWIRVISNDFHILLEVPKPSIVGTRNGREASGAGLDGRPGPESIVTRASMGKCLRRLLGADPRWQSAGAPSVRLPQSGGLAGGDPWCAGKRLQVAPGLP